MRKDGYVVVQPWMVTDYNLNGNKLLIYALIWGFSQDEQSCFYGSVSYIVEYFKLGAECAPKKENNNKSENKGPSATRFSPPTVEQVRAYFRERGVPPADAQTEADKFVDRYEANGWIVGKTKMKDWKAAARNWLRNRKEWGQPAAQPTTPYGGRTWEDL